MKQDKNAARLDVITRLNTVFGKERKGGQTSVENVLVETSNSSQNDSDISSLLIRYSVLAGFGQLKSEIAIRYLQHRQAGCVLSLTTDYDITLLFGCHLLWIVVEVLCWITMFTFTRPRVQRSAPEHSPHSFMRGGYVTEKITAPGVSTETLGACFLSTATNHVLCLQKFYHQ